MVEQVLDGVFVEVWHPLNRVLDFKTKTKVGKHADFDVPICEVEPEREVAPLWVGVWADTNFGLQTGFVKASGDDFFGVFGVGFVVN